MDSTSFQPTLGSFDSKTGKETLPSVEYTKNIANHFLVLRDTGRSERYGMGDVWRGLDRGKS